MRISKLSEQAGLPIGTVKFYLRTGLLPHGRATSATQAEYDESHVERLRLIRALLEVGGLSHAQIQRLLDAMALPTGDTDDSVRLVYDATAEPLADDVDLAPAEELVQTLGWAVNPDSPQLPMLARALSALAAIGREAGSERLRAYADAATHVARVDLAAVREAHDDERSLEAVAGTVLYDAVLVALRRLAVENQLAREKAGVPAPRVSMS